jgi:AcrR family transcriptional regulator
MGRTKADDAPDGAEPADGRSKKVYRRRREILDAAARIFYEKGYDATSTKDIADAAGLLKGSLYYYIDSKEDFLFEIIKESHDGALATLDRVREFQGDPLEKLAFLIREHLRYFVENLVTTTVYFREYRVLSPDRKAVIAAEGDVYLEFVRRLLDEGRTAGLVAEGIDVRIVSIGIVGMLNSAWMWYQPGGSRSTDEIAAEFVKVVLAGVACDEAIARAGSAAELRRGLADGLLAAPPIARPARTTTRSAPATRTAPRRAPRTSGPAVTKPAR